MKKKLCCLFTALCILSIGFAVGIHLKENKRLSEEEIEQLREQYPICGTEEVVLGFYIPTSVEQDVEAGSTYTFVLGKIIGDCETYYRQISTGVEVLDEKLGKKGLGFYEFYEYPVEVLEDINGYYQSGDIISIAGNRMLREQKPDIQEGMTFIIPLVHNDNGKEGRNYFTEVGMYYVTEDGYAISAYDEAAKARTVYSGLKTDAVLKKLKKLFP